MNPRPANRLASQASPYLLQHAHNPVDWFPWGSEALEEAKANDRPLFLSIGYAACHWCHVMERESFEDEETARFLNEHFVPVKVDREERPDLDGIYMDAVQRMTGHGGWPMSVWLTPNGRPFYAGTYFPKEPSHGMPSFMQVLHGLAEAWRTRRDEIDALGSRVTEAVASMGRLAASTEPLGAPIEAAALANLRGSFDPTWGGFGGAPKFPQPMVLEFVLRMVLRGAPDALEMLVLTMDKMVGGGVYDQVGGGFARYSTDSAWHVPHFEKMLYDNAQLALLYAHVWQATRTPLFEEVARGTLDYLLREMRHPGGAFFSSQDADSEGEEGKFYTWSWDELVSLVGEDAAAEFGATPEGNWDGANVLKRPVGDVGDAAQVLFEARSSRVPPGIDDKVLTAWNALAIRAFAEAGRVFSEPEYVRAAADAAAFVLKEMRKEDGRLLRSWRGGTRGPLGFSDDHALLVRALVALFETTAEVEWFDAALQTADALICLFADTENGGFFQTGSDAERLVIRPKVIQDNAVPSGNSAAADALQRLALLTGEARYESAGVMALRLSRDWMKQAPVMFGEALCALDLHLGPAQEVAIVGDPVDPARDALVDEVFAGRYRPNLVIALGDGGDSSVPLLEGRDPVDGKPAAYVCQRFVCQAPVTDAAALACELR